MLPQLNSDYLKEKLLNVFLNEDDFSLKRLDTLELYI